MHVLGCILACRLLQEEGDLGLLIVERSQEVLLAAVLLCTKGRYLRLQSQVAVTSLFIIDDDWTGSS